MIGRISHNQSWSGVTNLVMFPAMTRRGRKSSRVVTPTNNIARLRRERGLSLAQLAERMGPGWYPQKIERREKNDTKLPSDEVPIFARAMGVSDAEITGKRRTVAVAGYVGAGAEIIPFDDHEKYAGIDEIDCPLGLDHAHVVAVRVRGASMFPLDDGSDLFYAKEHDGVAEDAINRLSVVKLADGRMFVKHLARGSKPGLFTLISSNAPPIQDVEVEWAARVLMWLPGVSGDSLAA